MATKQVPLPAILFASFSSLPALNYLLAIVEQAIMLALTAACRPASVASFCTRRTARTLQRPAPANPRRASLLAVRASYKNKEDVSVQQGQEGPSASDFAALAQQLASSLTSELADPSTLDKLSRW